MKWNFTHRFHGRLVAYIIGCITATNKPTIACMGNESRATTFTCNCIIMHPNNLIQLDHDLHLSCTQMFAHVAALTSKGDEKHKPQRFLQDSPFK